MVAAGMVTSSQAVEFIAPAEGPVAFRRDKVPLESEMMGELSLQLTDLAYALPGTTAGELRCASQMLALATTLDPGNARARNLIEDFRKNRRRPDPDQEKLVKDRIRVWGTIAWLETTEAGPEGQALANCLKDVMAVSDPKDPRSETLLASGQQGAWNGWVQMTESFELGMPGKRASGGKNPGAGPALKLAEATVSTVIWQESGEGAGKWAQSLVPLTMKAGATEEKLSGFSLTIGSAGIPALATVASQVTTLLTSMHDPLPGGLRVEINAPGLTVAENSGKTLNCQAAAAVLANAAITGKEPDATILGSVDTSGNYTLPKGFWDQLRAVDKGKGGRLILPMAAADYLTALLAFENARFFLKYEVLLAKDFKQALEFSSKATPEAYATPLGQFAEIQAKATEGSVGSYLTNSFVRRRLAEISQAAPFHYSSKMLLIQGAGNRPTLIPKAVMTSEIRRALEPVADVAKSVAQSAAYSGSMATVYENARTSLDGLQRYAEKDDRTLLSQAQALVAMVRTMDRVGRVRTGVNDTSSLYDTQQQFTKLYSTVSVLLEAAGEPLPR
ncbi:MAG: hypothetical protein EOP88_11685 [Verrucomicrobiaceae bacterium]|nr:MAG: hypothetical protein EOP88_11685 [Verrucomicrobiaceae bacterium]